MKRLLQASAGVLLGLGLLGVGNAQPVTKAAKEEMAKLQGTWKIVAAEMAGKNFPDLKKVQVVIKRDTMALKASGMELKSWTFTVDPSRKPKAMDWIMGEEKAMTCASVSPCCPRRGKRPSSSLRGRRTSRPRTNPSGSSSSSVRSHDQLRSGKTHPLWVSL
jgi:uncharacterized protein (TIGR03067 family)